VRVERLNGLAPDEAERELQRCCASGAWARLVAAGRPYPDPAAVFAGADAAFGRLAWPEIADALAAHPRIGERTGDEWSRSEQSSLFPASTGKTVDTAGAGTLAALAEGNREYERKFGHVFLVCATGRSADEMLAALRERLGNDEPTERVVVADELRKITRLRLERLLA
jgi:2-oxo-4-hydroxy-4-carboxy-5-ureidoimidazoline decarboxylase